MLSHVEDGELAREKADNRARVAEQQNAKLEEQIKSIRGQLEGANTRVKQLKQLLEEHGIARRLHSTTQSAHAAARCPACRGWAVGAELGQPSYGARGSGGKGYRGSAAYVAGRVGPEDRAGQPHSGAEAATPRRTGSGGAAPSMRNGGGRRGTLRRTERAQRRRQRRWSRLPGGGRRQRGEQGAAEAARLAAERNSERQPGSRGGGGSGGGGGGGGGGSPPPGPVDDTSAEERVRGGGAYSLAEKLASAEASARLLEGELNAEERAAPQKPPTPPPDNSAELEAAMTDAFKRGAPGAAGAVSG